MGVSKFAQKGLFCRIGVEASFVTRTPGLPTSIQRPLKYRASEDVTLSLGEEEATLADAGHTAQLEREPATDTALPTHTASTAEVVECSCAVGIGSGLPARRSWMKV